MSNQEAATQGELRIDVLVIYMAVGCMIGGVGSTVIVDVADRYPSVSHSPSSVAFEDADEDGFVDAMEGKERLERASPGRMDVFVEVDWVPGAEPTREELALVERSFANLSVANPDGSTGVAVHMVKGNELPLGDRANLTVVSEMRDAQFANRKQGWHYMVISNAVVENVSNESPQDRTLAGRASYGVSVVEHGATPTGVDPACESHICRNTPMSPDDWWTVTMTHELGHSMGLRNGHFEGVDSWELSCEEYTSVMNYRCRTHTFSDSAPFDDGAFFEENLFTPSSERLDVWYLEQQLR
jgi:hypothetical protein